MLENIKKNSELYLEKNSSSQYYINAEIVASYILSKDKGLLINSKEKNANILGMLLRFGLMDEIILLSDEFKCSKFISNHKLYIFPSLYELCPNSYLNKNFSLNRPYHSLNDRDLLSEFESLDPKLELNKFIEIYAELFTRESEGVHCALSKIRPFPVIRNFYEHYLFKNDLEKFYQKILGQDHIVTNLLLINHLKNNTVTYNRAIINSIFSLFEKSAAADLILKNISNMNVHDADLALRILNAERYQSLSKKTGKFAICLSGQMRGGLDCLPFWINLARKFNVPIFISIWDRFGIPTGSHGNKLERVLPDFVKNDLSTINDYEFFETYPLFKNILSDEGLKDELFKVINDNKDVKIYYEINDEDSFNIKYQGYENQNQMKMFYNMRSVIRLMETKNDMVFENIIWARPDFFIKDYKYNFVGDNKIKTSFTGDGAQCGDFLIQINTANASVLSDLFGIMSNKNKTSYYKCAGPNLIGKHANKKGLYISRFNNNELIADGLRSIAFKEDEFYSIAREYNFGNSLLNEKVSFYNELHSSYPDISILKELYDSLKLDRPKLLTMIKQREISLKKTYPKVASELLVLINFLNS